CPESRVLSLRDALPIYDDSAGASRGNIVRIFLPTRLTTAQSGMRRARQSDSRSRISVRRTSSENISSAVSIDTVTFVCDVDTRRSEEHTSELQSRENLV